MKYIALICARGGSKGVPNKNIRELAGRPLIGWSIHVAKQVQRISDIIVSTDSEKIAELAKAHGATVPFLRPEFLARDDSPEWMVWRHTIDFLQASGIRMDGLVVIPPTSPLRIPRDIDNCLDVFERGGVDVVITVSESKRSPYFNMVRHDEKGNAVLVIPPEKHIFRRQDVPQVFDITTVAYVVRPDFVKQYNSMFDGCVRTVEVPPERAIDIDTVLDLEVAECLMEMQGKI